MTGKPYSEWTREEKDQHNQLRAESRDRARAAAKDQEYEPHESVTEHTADQIMEILGGARPKSLWGRKRGFVDWTPKETAGLGAVAMAVKGVLEEYRAFLPITIRQIGYRLIGTGVTDDKKIMDTLSIVCGHMRRAQMIPMDAIRDDGGIREDPLWWEDEEEWVANSRLSAEQARLDRQEGQAQRLIIRCEAAGMVPQIAKVADPYGVRVISSGGTDSITEKHDLGTEDYEPNKNPCGVHVLHIGDLDPNGIHIFIALSEDASAFADTAAPDFTRLAVTPEQIERLNLTTNPLKRQINKAGMDQTPAYPWDFTCQAEAIPPDELANIVRRAITTERQEITGYAFNVKAYNKVLSAEKKLRKSLLKRLGELT